VVGGVDHIRVAGDTEFRESVEDHADGGFGLFLKRRDTNLFAVGAAGLFPVKRLALDGVQRGDEAYAFENRIPSPASFSRLGVQAFTDYKAQAEVERRFANVKGPLRVQPLFLKNNDRILALVTVILLALTVFCLMEREARRNLPAGDGKLGGLLPENRAARPTGRNILRKLNTQTLILSKIDDQLYKERGPLTDIQKRLLQLLGVQLMKFG